jgi:hypothetical protein
MFANKMGKKKMGDEKSWQEIASLLQQMNEKLERLLKLGETRESRSRAGKASAESRRQKFGDARPPTEPAQQLELVREQKPTEVSVREQKPPKKKSVREQTDGSKVWDVYQTAFVQRHGVQPIRDARANRHCSDLVKRVGADRAIGLVVYYVSRSDAQYLKSKHPLGILILDVQKLNTEMQTGQKMTNRDALRAETAASNEETIRQYLANPENVYNDEEKDAAARTVR